MTLLWTNGSARMRLDVLTSELTDEGLGDLSSCSRNLTVSEAVCLSFPFYPDPLSLHFCQRISLLWLPPFLISGVQFSRCPHETSLLWKATLDALSAIYMLV